MATTTHYGFKLFESADKPTWLENWNQTMSNIDQALYNISTGGGDLPDLTEVVQRIQALEGRMTSAELRLNEDEGAISDLQDTVEELSGLASRLSTLESTVANNTNRISSLETDLGTVRNTDIPSLQSGITGVQAKNTEQDQQISGLDTRVTALEGAEGDSLQIHNMFFAQSAQTPISLTYPIRAHFVDYNNESGSYFKDINNFDELVAHLTNNGKHRLIFFIYYMSDESSSPYTYKNVSVQVIPTIYFNQNYKRYLNLDHFTANNTALTLKGSTASSSYNQYLIYAI